MSYMSSLMLEARLWCGLRMKIPSLPLLMASVALAVGAPLVTAPAASAATGMTDCLRFMESRFEDFDGAGQDGLVSPSDLRAMAWLLPSDCEPQLQHHFGAIDVIRQSAGSRGDGLWSRADVLTAIARGHWW